jgi:phage tail protein X
MIVETLTRPEPLDLVCRRLYGDESGYVEPVLALNPGLSFKSLVLPVGTRINLPDTPPTPVSGPNVVTLWD